MAFCKPRRRSDLSCLFEQILASKWTICRVCLTHSRRKDSVGDVRQRTTKVSLFTWPGRGDKLVQLLTRYMEFGEEALKQLTSNVVVGSRKSEFKSCAAPHRRVEDVCTV